jgi:hypothetical protein
LSGISSLFSEKIQYDDPKTLEEAIRRAKCLYDQHMGRTNIQKAWEKEEREYGEKEERAHATIL